MKRVMVGVFGLLVGLSAHAAGNRYIVKVKSPSTFNNIVMELRHQSPAFFKNPQASNFRLFSQTAVRAEALENLGMLIVESREGVADLVANPDVEFVEQEVIHPLPKFPMSKLPAAKSALAENVARPWGIDAVKAPQAWMNSKGERIKVLVLDTGVDASHPALKSRFLKGQNFVTDGQPMNDVSDSIGHGTHVAGTILADGENGGLVGVAPKSELLMGRVCATNGCSSISIIQGVNWGIDEGVHVMSLSLSGPFATSAEQDAFNKAELANAIVIAASGNDSASTVGFPAALPSVLAIGAVDSNLTRATFSNYGSELAIVAPGVAVLSAVPRGHGRGSSVQLNSATIQSIEFSGSPVGSIHTEVVFANFGKPEDFQGLNVQGKIALISRGAGVSFHDKALNAIAAGASAVLIFNNKAGLEGVTVSPDGNEIAIPAVMITQQDGDAIRASLATGQKMNMTVGVLATDYMAMQGTSMATPHVAGVAALVRSANPALSAAQVRALLKDTATKLTQPNDNNEYGSGLVNADAAVRRALLTAAEPVRLANGF